MASSGSVTSLSSRSARGSKKACNFCKRRHLKCDGLEPSCSHCEHRNIQCAYTLQNQANEAANDDGGSLNMIDPYERPTKMAKLASTSSDSSFDSTIPPFQPSSDQVVAVHASSPIAADWSCPDPLMIPDAYSRMQMFSQPDFLMQPALSLPAAAQAPPFVPAGRISSRHSSIDFSCSPLPTPQKPFSQQPDIVVHPVHPGPSSNHLTAEVMLAFGRGVKPIFSGDFTMTEAEELQRFLASQSAKFASYNTRALIKLFLETIMVAHGCRHCGNSPGGNTYANKSYAVMVHLLRSRSRNDAEFTNQIQNIVSGMELMAYYCIGSDDMIHARQAISEAYRLSSIYKSRISPVTYHRILSLEVSCSVRDSDALDFLQKSRAVALDPDNPAIASGYVMLAMGLIGRHFAHGDLSQIVPTTEPLTPQSCALLQEALNVVAQAEDVINRLERSHSRNPAAPIQALVAVYRSVVDASRAVVLWKLGQPNQAAAEAIKVIKMGRAKPVAKLMYLISYATSLKVLRYLGYIDVFQQGLSILEQDAPMYEMVQRYCAELRQPIQFYEEDFSEDQKPAATYHHGQEAPVSPYNSTSQYSSSVSEAPDTPVFEPQYRAGHAPGYFRDPRSQSSETQSASSSSQLSPVTPDSGIHTGPGGETYAPVAFSAVQPLQQPGQSYGFDFVPHGSYAFPTPGMQNMPPETQYSGATSNMLFDSRYWDAQL